MIKIIGVRRWNGKINQNFEPHEKILKDKSRLRQYENSISDEMNIDFAYREKVSKPVLMAFYSELGIDIKKERKKKREHEKRS